MGTDVKSISETKTPAPPSKKKKKKKKSKGERAENRARYKIDGSQCSQYCNKMNLSPYCL